MHVCMNVCMCVHIYVCTCVRLGLIAWLAGWLNGCNSEGEARTEQACQAPMGLAGWLDGWSSPARLPYVLYVCMYVCMYVIQHDYPSQSWTSSACCEMTTQTVPTQIALCTNAHDEAARQL